MPAKSGIEYGPKETGRVEYQGSLYEAEIDPNELANSIDELRKSISYLTEYIKPTPNGHTHKGDISQDYMRGLQGLQLKISKLTDISVGKIAADEVIRQMSNRNATINYTGIPRHLNSAAPNLYDLFGTEMTKAGSSNLGGYKYAVHTPDSYITGLRAKAQTRNDKQFTDLVNRLEQTFNRTVILSRDSGAYKPKYDANKNLIKGFGFQGGNNPARIGNIPFNDFGHGGGTRSNDEAARRGENRKIDEDRKQAAAFAVALAEKIAAGNGTESEISTLKLYIGKGISKKTFEAAVASWEKAQKEKANAFVPPPALTEPPKPNSPEAGKVNVLPDTIKYSPEELAVLKQQNPEGYIAYMKEHHLGGYTEATETTSKLRKFKTTGNPQNDFLNLVKRGSREDALTQLGALARKGVYKGNEEALNTFVSSLSDADMDIYNGKKKSVPSPSPTVTVPKPTVHGADDIPVNENTLNGIGASSADFQQLLIYVAAIAKAVGANVPAPTSSKPTQSSNTPTAAEKVRGKRRGKGGVMIGTRPEPQMTFNNLGKHEATEAIVKTTSNAILSRFHLEDEISNSLSDIRSRYTPDYTDPSTIKRHNRVSRHSASRSGNAYEDGLTYALNAIQQHEYDFGGVIPKSRALVLPGSKAIVPLSSRAMISLAPSPSVGGGPLVPSSGNGMSPYNNKLIPHGPGGLGPSYRRLRPYYPNDREGYGNGIDYSKLVTVLKGISALSNALDYLFRSIADSTITELQGVADMFEAIGSLKQAPIESLTKLIDGIGNMMFGGLSPLSSGLSAGASFFGTVGNGMLNNGSGLINRGNNILDSISGGKNGGGQLSEAMQAKANIGNSMVSKGGELAKLGGIMIAVQAIGTILSGILQIGIAGIKGAFSIFKSLLSTVLKIDKQMLSTSPVFQAIQNILNLAYTMLFLPMATAFSEQLIPVVLSVLDFTMKIGEGLASLVSAIPEDTMTRLTTGLDNILSTFTVSVGAIDGDYWNKMVDSILDIAKIVAGKDFQDMMADFLGVLPDMIKLIGKVLTFITSHSDDIVRVVDKGGELVGKMLEDGFFISFIDMSLKILDILDKNWDTFSSSLVTLIDAIPTLVKAVVAIADVVAWGKNVSDAIGNLSNNPVNNAVKSVNNTIQDNYSLTSWLHKNGFISDSTYGLLSGNSYATGGYVPATPGGQLVTVAEGGEGEYIVPESKMGGVVGGVTINFNGPVYGTDDFKAKVKSIVTEVTNTSYFR